MTNSNLNISNLDFKYPENLVALQPADPSRVMHIQTSCAKELSETTKESSIEQILSAINEKDILVLNNTKVLQRRIFALDGAEILFLESKFGKFQEWKVLFPSKKYKIGDNILLPGDVKMTLVEKGRPQSVLTSEHLTEEYFVKYGELPLPPYIQKARQERHNQEYDQQWYQTVWAKKPGSFAAPTASLHFKEHHLEALKRRGVKIIEVTLHVGLGTFLPVEVENLLDHKMHFEQYEVSEEDWRAVQNCKIRGGRVWGLGTTVVRTLESVALTGQLSGSTDLLILPGFKFQIVDVLMTNFHQPRSTLIALVMAFAEEKLCRRSQAMNKVKDRIPQLGDRSENHSIDQSVGCSNKHHIDQSCSGIEKVKECYQWAIEKKFRLFSYGDLTVWE